MTKNDILQDCKIKYIDHTYTYNDGAKCITDFFLNYFRVIRGAYKSYHALFKRLYTYDISIMLTPNGFWYYEHNIFYGDITKQLDKKIKSIMKQLNYKYLYDI